MLKKNKLYITKNGKLYIPIKKIKVFDKVLKKNVVKIIYKRVLNERTN